MTEPRFAGMGGHHSQRSKTDVWLTPPYIIEALGPFDLDPCAAIDQPWPTAAHHFTIADNGLLQEWFGRIWLNPPYNHMTGKWLARMADHGRGTALIFARTETDKFFRWVWDRADALLFLRGRINFHRPDGARALNNSGAPVVLVAYSAYDAERLGDGGLNGRFIALRLPPAVLVAFPPSAITWQQLIRAVVERQSGRVELASLYALVEHHPKAALNPHWRDKVRQVVQQAPFRRIERGVYELAAA